jgi:hypothetical protein
VPSAVTSSWPICYCYKVEIGSIHCPMLPVTELTVEMVQYITVWCCSHSHRHFCIAEIGRAVLPAFLIPLVKMLYLVIRTTLQDRILIAQKLTELLILTHCQFGRGNLLLDIAGIQPPIRRLILPLPPQNS